MENEKQYWYDISSIVKNKLVMDLKGKTSYKYVYKLITLGHLKSEKFGGVYRVHIDWIDEFNSSGKK